MFQKTEVLKKGFTIIEILLSGAIGLLLLLVMAKAFINFQKMGLMQNDNAKKHATVERTLMMLKSELIQAGYGLASYHQGIQITDQSLCIQKDIILMAIWKTRMKTWFISFSMKIKSFPENLVKAISRSSWNRYTLFFFHAHLVDFEQKGITPFVRMHSNSMSSMTFRKQRYAH